jgi:two-component system, OmpR family, phosphate regulon sensor histidine kinase PhoR
MFATQIKALDVAVACVLLATQIETSNRDPQSDIIERKQSELDGERLLLELEVQRALLETVIDSAPVGIILYDREMQVLGVNTEYARLAGSGAGQPGGRSFWAVVPEPGPHRQAHDRVLTGEAVNEEDVRCDFPNGEVRYCDFRFRPVRDVSRGIIAVVGMVIDVTLRHELDEQREEFTTRAAHELRTPLTSIKGFAKISLQAAANTRDERLVRSLRIINEQSDRMARFIEELVDVSSIRRQALPLRLEAVEYYTLVSELIARVKLTAPQFTFDLRLPDGLVWMDADRRRMQEALTNLVQNAIKYSDRSRRIEVVVKCEDKEVVTYVRDFGVGIPAAEQGRIFEGFYRATNVSSSRYSGLGLGLCISKSIISRHGGRMWVESSEGVGSNFYFALPLA